VQVREQVVLDRSHSGRVSDEDVRGGPWPDPESTTLSLHAYVDHAVVEFIAGGGTNGSDASTALAAWVAPTSAASNRLALFSEVPGVTLVSLDVWQLASPSVTVV
jgi:hypothetical protein